MDRAAGVQSARGSGGARPPAVLSAAAQRQAHQSSSNPTARGQIDPGLDRMASTRQGYSTGAKSGALQGSGRRWARRRRVGATKHAGERHSGLEKNLLAMTASEIGREGGTDAHHGLELSRRLCRALASRTGGESRAAFGEVAAEGRSGLLGSTDRRAVKLRRSCGVQGGRSTNGVE